MRLRSIFLCLGLAPLALTLTACSTTSLFSSSRTQTVTPVMGDMWQIDVLWPNEERAFMLRDHAREAAFEHCAKFKKSAQLLDAVSASIGVGQGSRAQILFRCVSPVRGPESTFFDADENK